MKTLTFTLALIVISACNPKAQDPSLNDDYVLIEFASKLEEHSEKFKALNQSASALDQKADLKNH